MATAADAQEPAASGEETVSSSVVKYLSFLLNQIPYAVPMDRVREVLEPPPITRVYHSPPSVEGICSIRGEILAIVRLDRLLNAREERDPHGSRLMVVRCKPEPYGFVVERMLGVMQAPAAALQPFPASADPADRLLAGVLRLPEWDRAVGVLDTDRILEACDLKAA
jgi:purine-binding chemotaxis protein CheW